MATHDLKTHPAHFAAVWSGAKRAELRLNDRGFAAGDTLRLREWRPDLCSRYHQRGLIDVAIGADDADEDEILARAVEAAYTGREIVAVVTHILGGGPWLAEGYVMLSLDVIERRAA